MVKMLSGFKKSYYLVLDVVNVLMMVFLVKLCVGEFVEEVEGFF